MVLVREGVFFEGSGGVLEDVWVDEVVGDLFKVVVCFVYGEVWGVLEYIF